MTDDSPIVLELENDYSPENFDPAAKQDDLLDRGVR
jgi:hypothetical protein